MEIKQNIELFLRNIINRRKYCTQQEAQNTTAQISKQLVQK